MNTTSANRLELLQIVDAVAREKLIDPEEVFRAIEESKIREARARYGAELDIRSEIDRRTGESSLTRARTVVEHVEDRFLEMSVSDAGNYLDDPKPGDIVIEELPQLRPGRIAAQASKQVILQLVREAERKRQYEEFKDRKGQIINGIVKREEYGNIVVDIGRGEAVVRRDQLINREVYRIGDRIRAYIRDVRAETRGPQIFLSRTANEFMAELFRMEVPEIYDGIIEIMAVARDPGSRAKIGVVSYDSSIDPVGACVGMRGSRVQAVVNELQGEKIDIIPWNGDAATFLVNALQPAIVTKVVMEEGSKRVEVVVPDDQLSFAIGRWGQNVRLASKLTGLDIDIMTEGQESERRQAEFVERTGMFMDALNIDEVVAQLLVSEEFNSVDEVAYVPVEELVAIEGFDQDTAEELQARSVEFLEEVNRKALEEAVALGVEQDLIEFGGLTPQMLITLARNGVKSLREFATFADWELAGETAGPDDNGEREEGLLEEFNVTMLEARRLVMGARYQLGIVTGEDYHAAMAMDDVQDDEPGFPEPG